MIIIIRNIKRSQKKKLSQNVTLHRVLRLEMAEKHSEIALRAIVKIANGQTTNGKIYAPHNQSWHFLQTMKCSVYAKKTHLDVRQEI